MEVIGDEAPKKQLKIVKKNGVFVGKLTFTNAFPCILLSSKSRNYR